MTEITDPAALYARALRRLRMERGLSLAEAGVLLGYDKGVVSRMERGERVPPGPAALSRAFGVPVADVLAPCPRCKYDPPAGFQCLRCGTRTELPSPAGDTP